MAIPINISNNSKSKTTCEVLKIPGKTLSPEYLKRHFQIFLLGTTSIGIAFCPLLSSHLSSPRLSEQLFLGADLDNFLYFQNVELKLTDFPVYSCW